MQPPLEAALEAVALRLSAARVPFLLGGSALLDALGLDVTVRDIDLMLRPEDREAFEAACADWLVAVTTEPGEVLSSEWKATLDVGGVEVDGLGGLGIRGGARRAVPRGRLAPLWGCRGPAVRSGRLARALPRIQARKGSAARASTAAGWGWVRGYLVVSGAS